jgi:DNA polymerase-3 subunit alpha
LKDILDKNAGECPVYFELETPHAYRVVMQSAEVKGVLPSDELMKTMESLLGEDSVEMEY